MSIRPLHSPYYYSDCGRFVLYRSGAEWKVRINSEAASSSDVAHRRYKWLCYHELNTAAFPKLTMLVDVLESYVQSDPLPC